MSKEIKMNRVIMRPNERQKEMIRYMMEKEGYKSVTATVENCISIAYKKLYPAYVEGRLTDPMDREKARLNRLKARETLREQDIIENQSKICDALNGTIKDGRCHYFVYNGKDRHEQILPLDMLTQDLVEAQYTPSKEKVERLYAEGKAHYVR